MCQFNISNLDLSDINNHNSNQCIFNSKYTDPFNVYNKIIANNINLIDDSEIYVLNQLERQVKPYDKEELKIIINYYSKYHPNGSLNWLDVSEITDMSFLFYKNEKFNGDISKWNVSSVTNMAGMFAESMFNGDISKWDVSKVYSMAGMFAESKFSQDISNWDLSKVAIKEHMWK